MKKSFEFKSVVWVTWHDDHEREVAHTVESKDLNSLEECFVHLDKIRRKYPNHGHEEYWENNVSFNHDIHTMHYIDVYIYNVYSSTISFPVISRYKNKQFIRSDAYWRVKEIFDCFNKEKTSGYTFKSDKRLNELLGSPVNSFFKSLNK